MELIVLSKEEMKRVAGEKAVDLIEDGMTIGLGTGSTVFWAIKKLGQRMKEGLRIQAIPTSKNTQTLAEQHGIPLTSFKEISQLDFTIDGADEINPQLQLIKGGGGALLREKLVAIQSRRLIIVADHSKFVPTLGAFPLPIEIVPFAWECTAKRIENLGCRPILRMDKNKPFVTDNKNYVLDCCFGTINQPTELHQRLKLLHGVIETGLFIGGVSCVILGDGQGAKMIENKEAQS
jgi:ribose 5-phosphate isomerase A